MHSIIHTNQRLPSCVTPSTELQEINEGLSTVNVRTDETHSQQQTNNMEQLRVRVSLACHDPDFDPAKDLIRWLQLCRIDSNDLN